MLDLLDAFCPWRIGESLMLAVSIINLMVMWLDYAHFIYGEIYFGGKFLLCLFMMILFSDRELFKEKKCSFLEGKFLSFL
jgi:hypothetical protein